MRCLLPRRDGYDAGTMSDAPRFALFTTPFGECGLAWNARGVSAVWLPETRRSGLRSRIERRFPSAAEAEPDGVAADAVRGMRALLAGKQADLVSVAIDLDSTSPFQRSVYAVARAIPGGRVLTYGAVAERVGRGATAQAVGQALGANPVPLLVPCHRVIAAHGRLGGFSAPGGTAVKRRLLALENARLDGPPELFDGAA